MMNCNSLFRLMGFLTLMMWNCGSFARKILRSGIHESVLLFRWINLEIGLFGTMAMLQILEPLLGSLYLGIAWKLCCLDPRLYRISVISSINEFLSERLYDSSNVFRPIMFNYIHKILIIFFYAYKESNIYYSYFFIYKYYDIDFFMSNRNFSEERLKCL